MGLITGTKNGHPFSLRFGSGGSLTHPLMEAVGQTMIYMLSESQLRDDKLVHDTTAMLLRAMSEKWECSIDEGVSTALPEGISVMTMEPKDLKELAGKRNTLQPGKGEELSKTVFRLQVIHASDEELTHVPDLLLYPNFAYYIYVKHQKAVGYLILLDDDADWNYETFCNVWVSRNNRGKGIASDLLRFARSKNRVVWLTEPITEGGGQLVSSVAPEMWKHGRNDPCPCGSGAKFKKCCGKHPRVQGAVYPEMLCES